MKRLLPVFFLFVQISVFGSVYNGKIKKMKQPDGTRVDLRLFGSEFYIRAEGLDGYTLIRDEKGWICYANLAPDGKELISTRERYIGKVDEPSSLKELKNIPKHLDLRPEAIEEIIQKNSLALSGGVKEHLERPGHPHFHGTPIVPVKGKIKGLTILVDFSDEPVTVSVSEVFKFMNDTNYTGYGNKGSLRSYFREVSGGLIDYENVVYGYYRAPRTFAYYDSLSQGRGAREILGLALNWLENQGFDFSTLSLNEDSTIRAINLLHTGEPPAWGKGMWPHKGTYHFFESASGIKSLDYNSSPANSPLGIGMIAHENGHMIGKWPDTYKYSSFFGPDGIGAFDLMCWYGSETNPVPPNPLFRQNVGWGKYVDVSNWNTLIRDTANSRTAYRYNNPSDTNEFYLFESRRKIGRNAEIPDAGLTIWHIDRNGDNQTRHHEVRLVKANNDSVNYSGACFRALYKSEFSQTTNPQSSWYSGDPSGLKLWTIGPRAGVMTYKIGAGVPASNIKLKYLGISDNNGNGFPESGEPIFLNCEISNPGQLASGNCVLTCSAIGANSNLVSISTPVQNLGALPVDSVLTNPIGIQISPLAQAGDEVIIQVQINDGTQTLSVTRTIMIGKQLRMANLTDSTCDALFYDPKGNDLYQNSTDLIQTIYPTGPGQKLRVQFLDFFLQYNNDCGNDYLKIYNGPGTDSPSFGIWCAENSPGTLTSTDTTGALTFEFHSDEIFYYPGWKAKLSCFTQTSVNQELASVKRPRLFPNPGNGLFHFSHPEEIRRIRVFNALGKELSIQSSTNGFGEGIDLRNIKGRMFLFQFETHHGFFVEKGFKEE